jgi:5-methylcytosine-specific restriction endonuclease McrA
MPNQPKMVHTDCVVCGESFQTAAYNLKRGQGRYCSTACRYSNNRKEVNCYYCKKKFTKSTSRVALSKNHFCSQKCKYDAASDTKHPYSTGPAQKDGKHTYRARAMRLKEQKCVRCGYDEHIELLDVDHIDSDRNNNSIDNLQVLCVTCHAIKTRKPNIF